MFRKNRWILSIPIVLLLLSAVWMPAQAQDDPISTFDPDSRVLFMPLVQTPEGQLKNVFVRALTFELVHYEEVEEEPDVDPQAGFSPPPRPTQEPEPEIPGFDPDGGTVGVLPGGGTCFLGVTPDCEPYDW